MNIHSFWTPPPETNSSTSIGINIYISMGFDMDLSERAFTMFGDNVQEATTWLLRQSSLGEFPKRLKQSNTEFKYTFYKSKLKIDDDTFYVTDYNPDYNIIQISPINMYFPMSWLPLSDPSIVWKEVKHDSPPVLTKVKYNWTRTIGALTLDIKNCRFWSWAEFLVLTGEHDFGNLRPFNNQNRTSNEPLTENEKLIFSLYRLTNKKDAQFRFTPNYPRVAVHCWDSRRINAEKHLQWSKFVLICEISNIPEIILNDLILSRNSNDMREKILNLVQLNVSENIINDLLKTWRHYKKPKDHIVKQNKKWDKYCKSFLSFSNMEIVNEEDGMVKLDIMVNDLMFNNRYKNDVLGMFNTFHSSRKVNFVHLRRIFDKMFGGVKSNLRINNWILLEDWEKKFWERCKKKSKKFTHSYNKDKNINMSKYNHQNAAISWLLDKENNSRSFGLVGWNKMEEPDGFTWWRSSWGFIKLTAASPDNVVGGYPCKGGLLCQCVGAGKTFELIKLIEIQKQKLVITKPTLLIVPTSMLTIWEDEIKKFSDVLTCVLYHGPRRKNINIDNFDVVITTYRLTVNEHNNVSSSLFQADTWGRIICDECHYIKDVYSKTFKAVNSITAPVKWCVSATPFAKNFLDLSAYLCFLGIHPFNEKPRITLNGLLNMAESEPSLAELFFNAIEKNVFYQTRLTMNNVSKLKPITVKYKQIDIQTTYKPLYDALYEGAKERIKNYSSHSNIMQMIQRMRYAAFHPAMILKKYYGNPLPIGKGGVPTAEVSFESFKIEDGGKYNDTIKQKIKDYKENGCKCCVCLDVIDRPTMTACGHMFCYECIHNAFSHQTTKHCPICRNPLENKLLYELKEDAKDMAASGDTIMEAHINDLFLKCDEDLNPFDEEGNIKEEIGIPKIKWIIEKLKDNKKLILFTQYMGAFCEMRAIFDIKNIKYRFIDGSMPIKKRGKAINDFQTKDDIKLFLLTTKSSNTGITLTSASEIIFLEPCINKSKYIQAIGRINRLGQTKKSLNVYTLVTENSIEPHIDNKIGTLGWLEKIKLI